MNGATVISIQLLIFHYFNRWWKFAFASGPQGGMYLFQLMDFYAASGMSLLWICFFQTIAISWVYGNSKFEKNIQQMLGHRPHWFWSWCWKAFSPVMMAVSIALFGANFSTR